ncbi:FKBP-type peptidyl-prolyl cis-trans isomerase [archaeon]|nr:FKBP-type peptidyl-prolyl cis-trans isomerase [archaeon]
MARIKKEEKKNNTLLLVLVGIMVFGTVAGGLLFQSPQDDQALLTTPPPLTLGPQEEIVTIKHNPSNTTLVTTAGYQTITYDNNSIYIDSNHPLVGSTLIFDIQVTNITRENFTGDMKNMTVEAGDVVEVNYTGRLAGGEVFDTSRHEIAINDSIPKVSWFNMRQLYQPLAFIAGAGMMIQGFDEAARGMKINETKTVEILPEEGYGLHNSSLLQAMPITQSWQKGMELKKYIELTKDAFKGRFGDINITKGAIFNVPGTNFNASIYYDAGDLVVVEMLPGQGDVVRFYEYPWDSTVVSVLPGQINLKHNLESGDVIQFEGLPWNSTVL